jgi:hypothetical protein
MEAVTAETLRNVREGMIPPEIVEKYREILGR